MAAALTDLFTYVAYGTLTHLASPGYTVGNSSINADDLSAWSTTTAVYFGMDIVDASGARVDGSYTAWKAIVSGNTLGSLTLQYGTDQDYPAGTSTRLFILDTSALWNALIDGLSVLHNKDGTLKDGIIATSKIADSAITSVKIADGTIVTADLANAAITPNKLNLSPSTNVTLSSGTTTSTSYTPTLTGATAQTATATVGVNGVLLIGIWSQIVNSGTNLSAMSFALSGANTVAASNNRAIAVTGSSQGWLGSVFVVTGLTAGATVATANFAVAAGTGTYASHSIFAVSL